MGVAIEVLRPSPQLARYVDEVRILRGIRHGSMRVARFPDGTAALLLRVLGSSGGDLSVSGPRTRALFKTVPPAELAISIQFKPGGAAPFLGVPAHRVTDRIVHLEDLWGAEGARLRDALLCAKSEAGAIAELERALVERARRALEPGAAQLARRAVRMLRERDGAVRIDALAGELGVTARHLRRAFAETVGVGPKEFARMARLQRALRAAASRATWTQIAADAGYYDQAHLIAEFRDLVGVTPSGFAKGPGAPAVR